MKQLKYIGLLTVALATVACTNIISDAVNSDGTLGGELRFPALDDATQPEGIFPNLEDLSKIDSGMTKKDLYHLIERPHFHEMNGAKEWDYIMKFRQPDRSVKICQYKVLFDKDNIARSFFWKPANCLNQKINISADALFPFDRGGVDDIKPEGRQRLDALAKQIIAERNKPYLQVVGYSDYLGDARYNLSLSQQRAESVRQYLINRGVTPEHIAAKGMGESNPVVSCDKQSRAALIRCLAPNRRVHIDINRH